MGSHNKCPGLLIKMQCMHGSSFEAQTCILSVLCGNPLGLRMPSMVREVRRSQASHAMPLPATAQADGGA